MAGDEAQKLLECSLAASSEKRRPASHSLDSSSANLHRSSLKTTTVFDIPQTTGYRGESIRAFLEKKPIHFRGECTQE